MEWPRVRIRMTTGVPPETRQRMIQQTNAFLTMALMDHRPWPRIPRRRVDQGGFAELVRRPGGRQMVQRFWQRVLESVPW